MAIKIKKSQKIESFQKMSVIDGTKTYAELRQKVAKEGIFERAYGFYSFLTLFVFSGFFLSIYFIFITTSKPLLIIWGVLFSFFAVQMAGLLHDAGHRAIFKTTRANDFVGNIFGSFLAEGYTFWKVKHNMHHAHPNEDDEDPDVALPILSFTKEAYRAKTGIAKILCKYQVYLYYPIGLLLFISPRLGTIKYFLKVYKPKMLPEIVIFSISLFAWFFLQFFIFDLSKALLLFIVTNTTIGFYLLNVFAPNHKGMPYLEKGVKLSFLEQQIITSRNIKGHWLTDFVYMGLNYQIEHHLFPNTPRNKLKHITPFVLELCRKKKLEYTEVSVIETNKIILSELHQVAATA